MKKKISLLLLVCVIIATFSGCGLKTALNTSHNELPNVLLDEEIGLFDLTPDTVSYLHSDRFAIYEKGELVLRVYDGEEIYTDSVYIPGSYDDYTLKCEHNGYEVVVNAYCGAMPKGNWSFSSEDGFSDSVTISAEFGQGEWRNLRYFTIPKSFSIFDPSLFSRFSDSGDVVLLIWMIWLIVLHVPAILFGMLYFYYMENCFKRKPITNIWGVLLELDCLLILPCLLIPGALFLYQRYPAPTQYVVNTLNYNGLLGFPYTVTLHSVPSLSSLTVENVTSFTPYLAYIALAVGILLILLRIIFRPAKAGILMTLPAVLLGSLIGTPLLLLICLWFVPLVIILVLFLGLVFMGGSSGTEPKKQKALHNHDVVQIRDSSGAWHTVILDTNELFAHVTFVDTGANITLKADPSQDGVYLDEYGRKWYL